MSLLIMQETRNFVHILCGQKGISTFSHNTCSLVSSLSLFSLQWPLCLLIIAGIWLLYNNSDTLNETVVAIDKHMNGSYL